jgi:murein DD-endopeptidase MepM/ murein hydrolase activator NlpD
MSFSSPVGTEEERNSGKIWPGTWLDATPYGTEYRYGIHTGADLNWNTPRWDADAHAPVYAIGEGKVTYAQRWPNPKYWGNIIVIDHGIVDGKPLFSRYAHVENIKVSPGQSVSIGDQICQVGNGFGLFAYHLHFDISTTKILLHEPQNWPAPKATPYYKGQLRKHYVDPRAWLQQAHVVENITPKPTVWYVIDPAGVPVRNNHGLSAEQVGSLSQGSELSIDETKGGRQDGYLWAPIKSGQYEGFWVAIRKQDQSETYVSTNPPSK